MNFRSSSYTGRAARDLDSAFGPYTSRQFVEPMHWQDKVVTVASAIAAVALGAVLIWGAI